MQKVSSSEMFDQTKYDDVFLFDRFEMFSLQIYDDVASLISSLGPILFLTKNRSPGAPIHPDLVKRFEGKVRSNI